MVGQRGGGGGDAGCQQLHPAGRRRNVNCLRHAVIWYEDHRQRCPYEPRLAELDPSVGLYTTAVWQCERGHRYFQDLHSPLRPLSDSDGDSDAGADGWGSRGDFGARGRGWEWSQCWDVYFVVGRDFWVGSDLGGGGA